jgi:hypothetical protein
LREKQSTAATLYPNSQNFNFDHQMVVDSENDQLQFEHRALQEVPISSLNDMHPKVTNINKLSGSRGRLAQPHITSSQMQENNCRRSVYNQNQTERDLNMFKNKSTG